VTHKLGGQALYLALAVLPQALTIVAGLAMHSRGPRRLRQSAAASASFAPCFQQVACQFAT
jgi:hypothetical protein